MADEPQAPAGWYTDPENPPNQRYWDGRAWAAPGAPPPPPPYAIPPYMMQRQTTNGFAIASMVLGILWIYWVGSVLALIFGYMAKRQIAESNGREGGGGMATAGIVLGWIAIGFAIILIALVVIVSVTDSSSSNTYP